MDRQKKSITRAAFLKAAAATGALALIGDRSALGAAARMQTRVIPKTNEALPVVGLGTWRVFDVGPDAAVRAARRQILSVLFEAGGSVIDSSPMYGRAESVVGDELAALGARHKAFLATKVWTRGRNEGIAQMEESMRHLGTERIDLMQVHNLVDLDTHLATLREWKAAGRIRYLGVTHWTRGSLDDLAEIIAREKLDFVQFAYSIAARDAERRLFPLCAERGVATLINRPYVHGALFGRARGHAVPSWAAEELGCASWGQFFLKFILGHPQVTCVIPGTSKPRHARDNMGAGTGALPNSAQRKRMLSDWRRLGSS
jgi:aryl-alcohol dehydrogenase-like predicted oxidoreductase